MKMAEMYQHITSNPSQSAIESNLLDLVFFKKNDFLHYLYEEK